MTKVAVTACLLMACSLAGSFAGSDAMAKDPVPLVLPKGARVGVITMLDPEVTHYHTAKELAQSFLKTLLVSWQIDPMLTDPVAQRLTQMGLVPVALSPSDSLARGRDEFFVDNSVVKGLPRDCAKQFALLAASEHLDALIVLAPSLNNTSQGGSVTRRGLPDYLRGLGFVTANEGGDKPQLFNMTQMLLIGVNAEGATLRAREWGGTYAVDWPDYTAPADPKQISPEQLDKLQPLFARMLAQQAGRLVDRIQVSP
jgi:hypothetical protein